MVHSALQVFLLPSLTAFMCSKSVFWFQAQPTVTDAAV